MSADPGQTPTIGQAKSAGPKRSFLVRFDSWWGRQRPWVLALWISRASVVSVIFGALLFTIAQAVHDILRGLAQDVALLWLSPNQVAGATGALSAPPIDWHRLCALIIGSFLWAACVHYTARILLWVDFGMLPQDSKDRNAYRKAFTHVPRILGVLSFGAVIAGLLVTWYVTPTEKSAENLAFAALILLMVFEILLFILYVRKRVESVNWTGGLFVASAKAAAAMTGAAVGALRKLGPKKTEEARRTHAPNFLMRYGDHVAQRLKSAKSALPSDSPIRVRDVLHQDTERVLSYDGLVGLGAAAILVARQPSRGLWKLLDWVEIKSQSKDAPADVQPLYVASAARNRGRGKIETLPSTIAGHAWLTLVAILFILIGIGLGGMLWAMTAPLSMARATTQSGILFLILMTWLPFFSILAFLEHWRQFPMLLPVAVVCLIAQAIPGDVHEIRLLSADDKRVNNAPTRLQLDGAITAWGSANGATDKTPAPLIIVATAGGGSRAAYWTATVLGSLQDAAPRFRQRVFAISAVSGGALGAAIFAAQLRHEDEAESDAPFCRLSNDQIVPRTDKSRFKRCGQFVAAGDFLAPPFAAFGYQDALYWAVPIPLASDRSTAIEWAWETAWRESANRTQQDTDTGLFAEPFTAFAPRAAPGPWRPALLFNGTSVGTGKRVIASHLKFDLAGTSNRLALDSFDLFDLMTNNAERRIRLSTAVTIAARFPYVLPAGTMAGGALCPNDVCDRVVDGGYFENFGAATAEDLLLALLSSQISKPANGKPAVWLLADKKTYVYPVVVQISSDPELDAETPAPSKPHSSDSRMWTEIAAPPASLLGTQSARGVLAMQALFRRAAAMNVAFVHFSVRGDGGAAVAPLSWSLSNAAQVAIDGRLCDSFNRPRIAVLGQAIDIPELAEAACPR